MGRDKVLVEGIRNGVLQSGGGVWGGGGVVLKLPSSQQGKLHWWLVPGWPGQAWLVLSIAKGRTGTCGTGHTTWWQMDVQLCLATPLNIECMRVQVTVHNQGLIACAPCSGTMQRRVLLPASFASGGSGQARVCARIEGRSQASHPGHCQMVPGAANCR